LKDSNEEQFLQEVLVYLDQLKVKRPEIAHLISGGLDLIFDSSSTQRH
jgi:phenylalanine-4-hydroxylase